MAVGTMSEVLRYQMSKTWCALELVRADEPTLQRHVVAQQRIGDHAFAATEVFARMPCLHGGSLDAELLAVDTGVQRLQVERVAREDRQLGDGVADAVIGRLQRGQSQVLLVGGLQHVVRDVTGT